MSNETKIWERFHVVPFEVKQLEEKDDRYEFKGYASIFHIPDRVKDIVHPGAFKRTMDHNNNKFPLDWMHEKKEIIGGTKVHEDKKGWAVEPGFLIKGIQRAEEAYKLMKADVVDGMSFMYRAIQKKYQGGHRHLHELAVGSLTVGPSSLICHPNALITDVKTFDPSVVFNASIDQIRNIMLGAEIKIWEDEPEFKEIRYRKRNPDDFIRLRSFWLPGHTNSIRALGGPTEAGGSVKIQALRFLKSADWTLAKAQKWVEDHQDSLKFYDITCHPHYELASLLNKDVGPID